MGRLFSPATGTSVKATGPVMWSLMMPLFQGPHTEEGLAATAAAGEAEVTTSTAGEAEVIVSSAGEAEVIVSPTGEAEASSVPTEVPALSMTTEDAGEGVTLVSISERMFYFTLSGRSWVSPVGADLGLPHLSTKCGVTALWS